MSKKLQYIEESVDRRTGELSIVRKSFAIKSPPQEDFFFTFPKGVTFICALKSIIELRVLVFLCATSEFNEGKIVLHQNTRKELIEELGVSQQAFSNAIRSLRKKGAIAGGKGFYEINPFMFWRGTTDKRNSIIKDRLELAQKFHEEE